MSSTNPILESDSDYSSETLDNLYGFYNLFVVVTILTLDISETLNNEIIYIWKKKFGIISLLYFITRYVPFVINVVFLILTLKISTAETDNIQVFSAKLLTLFYCIPWFVVLACTENLFITRAVALNGKSRLLYYILIALFVGEMITAFVFYIPSVPPPTNVFQVEVPLGPDALGILLGFRLIVFPRVPSVVAFGVPELAFQSVLVLLILYTIVRHGKTWITREYCSLTTIIIRDGLWGYFFNLFGLLVVIAHPIWLQGPAGQPSIQWSYVTFSVTSTRLLLNIRSSAGGPGRPSKTIPSFSLSLNSRPETIEETS